MIEFNDVKLKYVGFLLFSILVSVGMLMFGHYWIPEKITQDSLLNNQTLNRGIYETLLDIESSLQSGEYNLLDNIPKRIRTESADITVIKMAEEKKVLPNVKYRVEIKFRHPYSVISRSTKLDAILVDVNQEQNHDFADLFWSLE